MLSSIGRAAIGRLISTPVIASSSRIVSSLSANSLRSGRLFVRSFATPGKPKASSSAKSATKAAATKGRTKPTAKAKATKATASSKSTKSTKSAKSTKSKTAAKSKAKSKVKTTAKTKAKKRPVSPERKSLLERRALKKAALFTKEKQLPDTTWTVFVTEQNKGSPGGPEVFRTKMTGLGEEYRSLPASRLQRLQAIAEQNKLSNAAAYKAWVQSYTPQEIHAANSARRLLKKKHNYPPKSGVKPIRDERLPKQPTTPFSLFTKARWASGDFANQKVAESAKQIGREWKSLSEADRLPYDELFKASSAQYAKEMSEVMPGRARSPRA